MAADNHDPFLVRGPAVIAFSGGRTSAYMLRRVLDAHGGRLPDDVLVCFANTGREHEGTLRFVHDCETRWGVHVRWLEFRRSPIRRPDGKRQAWAAEVDFRGASRRGEPFEALVQDRNLLPNPVSRFCTTELKIRTIRRWCVQTFGRGVVWTQVVGIRADEPLRVERMLNPDRVKKAGPESRKVLLPLAAAGVTKEDVLAFWRKQPFDLRLAGPWEGNCDGCFLKRKAFIARLWRDHPDRAAWWAAMEARMAMRTGGRGARFRKDWRGGYAMIGADVLDGWHKYDMGQPPPDEDGLDVVALCDVSCGA